MTHTPTHPRRRALGSLALAACLSAVAFAVAGSASAQKKTGAQKKPEKVKPGTDLLPGVEAPAQQPQATKLPPSILVRWQGKPGVSRYRLQLATDEKFEDVVFDQAVEGRQYVVRDLPPATTSGASRPRRPRRASPTRRPSASRWAASRR